MRNLITKKHTILFLVVLTFSFVSQAQYKVGLTGGLSHSIIAYGGEGA